MASFPPGDPITGALFWIWLWKWLKSKGIPH